MRITLQYFDGCPNWQTVDGHLRELAEDLNATLVYERIDDQESALARGFRGSPTIMVDGTDLFPDCDAQVGLACRIYQTEAGPAGSPTLDQLRGLVTTARRKVDRMWPTSTGLP